MDNRPIGIYDSGIGGLTGLKALRRLLPGEDLVFFADTGRMPYGPRPQEELCRIARQDMDFLAAFGVKAILAACGTISSAARAELERYPVPAFGVLTPAVEAMAALPGEKPLAVIATAASIESGQFTAPLRARCPGREIVDLACPEFAPMIEAGHIDRFDPAVCEAVARALAPLRGRDFDAV
ncbi:MAG: aspartate/glutamate racemase family protein, partial [Oscillospiraceae bacterium]|nr:aspartate/glutamate racemase family protein [Oscillospiraceae bacterium]